MSIAARIVEILTKNGQKIAIAESLTGGALCAAIVAISGASAVLDEAMTTYSNAAKITRLGVLSKTLATHGAVSAQCAAEMAEGIAKTAGADIGISTTGIAGPGGATVEKPVGLVFIGVYYNGKSTTYKYEFQGDRREVIGQVVEVGLEILYQNLKG